jgi:RNA polymerase sigma factor (sigma-70 family)
MSSINLRDENLSIWNRFREGDANAFAAIIRLHHQDLFNYATRFTKDINFVKDCMQELFLSLWKHRETINETTFVKYYLLKCFRRILNRSKSNSVDFNLYNDFQFDRITPQTPSIENKIILEEETTLLSERIKKVLKKISKREQEVIYLRFYLDADIDEIADIMCLNKQSVYNLQSDGLKKIKKLVQKKSDFFTEANHLIPALIIFEKILT